MISRDITPINLSELLDETQTMYRESFWPFVLISVVPQVPTLFPTETWPLSAVIVVVSMFLSILAGGATVHAVAAKRLGRTIHVIECYKRAWNRVFILTLVFIIYVSALIGSGLFLLYFATELAFLSLPVFFYLLVVWFFANEAIIIEGRGVNSLGRSAHLVSGSWWRVLGIGLVFILTVFGALVLTELAGDFVGFLNPVLKLVLMAGVGAMLTPLIFIGRTLLYIDLRTRREGYSLDILASELDTSGFRGDRDSHG